MFVRINYEDITNLSFYFFIILGVTMESALQLLSPLIALTPPIMPHHEQLEIHIKIESNLVLFIWINYGAMHKKEG